MGDRLKEKRSSENLQVLSMLFAEVTVWMQGLGNFLQIFLHLVALIVGLQLFGMALLEFLSVGKGFFVVLTASRAPSVPESLLSVHRISLE